jgi:hypothetical protein
LRAWALLLGIAFLDGIFTFATPVRGAKILGPFKTLSDTKFSESQSNTGILPPFTSRFRWIDSALTITEDGFYIDIQSYAVPGAHESLEWWTTDFGEAARATQQMDKELKKAGEITQRLQIKNAQGIETGERVLATYMPSPTAGKQFYFLIWTKGSRCSEITASSLDILFEFEEYAAASLPPIGGKNLNRKPTFELLGISDMFNEKGFPYGYAKEFRAEDGEHVNLTRVNLTSPEAVGADLELALKTAIKIIDREFNKDENGNTVGERIVARIGSAVPHEEVFAIIYTEGYTYEQITSNSLMDAWDFEFTLVRPPSRGGPQHPIAQADQVDAQALAGLQAEGERLLQILKNSDQQGFLAECSRKGVVFWADGDPLPPDVIAKVFKEKRSVYCTLFDTACLPHPDPVNKQYSFREMLNRAASIQVKSYKDPEACKRCGQVVFAIKGGDGPTKEHDIFLDFSFELENAHWQLVNAEYP